MTWTAISRADFGNPVTDGDLVASATYNSQVKGNLEHLYSVPRCEVYRSGDQTITNDTVQTVTWDSETFDTASIHSTVSNTGRLTLVRAGWWLTVALCKFSGSSTVGHRRGILRVNGTDIVGTYHCEASSSGDTLFTVGAVVYTTTTTDYVECRAYQNSGGNLAFEAGSAAASRFSAVWLGA